MSKHSPELRQLADSLVGKRVEVRWTMYKQPESGLRRLAWSPNRIVHRLMWRYTQRLAKQHRLFDPIHHRVQGVLTEVAEDKGIARTLRDSPKNWVWLVVDGEVRCLLDDTVTIEEVTA